MSDPLGFLGVRNHFEALAAHRRGLLFFARFLMMIPIVSGCVTVQPQMSPLVSDTERKTYRESMDSQKRDYYYDGVLRVSRIGYPILEKMPDEYRKKTVPRLPLVLLESKIYFGHVAIGDSEQGFLTVVGPIPGQAPASNRIQRGDTLVAVNGKPVKTAKDWKNIQAEMKDSVQVTVTLGRGPERWDQTLPVLKVGFDTTFLIDSQMGSVNAYLHPEGYIAFTPAMLRFLKNDDELAFVVSHEIAHGIKGHLGEAMANQVVGALAGSVVAALSNSYASGTGRTAGALTGAAVTAPFSQAMETEADELGLQLMRAAGYDPKGAVTFMERLAVEDPKSDDFAFLRTHPITRERMVHVEELAAGQKS